MTSGYKTNSQKKSFNSNLIYRELYLPFRKKTAPVTIVPSYDDRFGELLLFYACLAQISLGGLLKCYLHGINF
jgi:hypothetical protein